MKCCGENENNIRDRSCCGRLMAELNPCQPWFNVIDSSGRKIDFPDSFAPASCAAFAWKLILFCISLFTLIWGLVRLDASFYFASFSHLFVLLACLYSLFSLGNTTFAAKQKQPLERAQLHNKLIWVFFELSAHSGVIAGLFFWISVFDKGTTDLTFLNVFMHGPLALLIWIDGLCVNRTPVRWTHFYGFVLPFDTFYMIWTIIQDKSNLDGRDIIYDVFNWMEDWKQAFGWSVFFILGFSPIVYLAMWVTSYYIWPCCCKQDRRFYLQADKSDVKEETSQDEEGGSILEWFD